MTFKSAHKEFARCKFPTLNMLWYVDTLDTEDPLVQPVPWKMRLEMLVGMQIEILNGSEILVNWSKLRNSNFSVSRGTN